MSDSVWPHRRQPTRLPNPWDSPGKNTGVGCHFLLQCVKVKNESEVAQSCPTLSDPMDCSFPGSSVHGISQARVLEWVWWPSPINCYILVQIRFCFQMNLCEIYENLDFKVFWIFILGILDLHCFKWEHSNSVTEAK